MNSAILLLAAASLTLAERGKAPEVSIVAAEECGPTVRYAAKELSFHVREMTGVSLPIVSAADGAKVEIREIVDSALGTDGFRLQARGRDLIVEGGHRGVLYGVYEILETYGGCGWFSSHTEDIPKSASFAVPSDLDRTETPAFRTRELLWFDTCHPDFAARLRLNGNFHKPLARHGGNGFRFGGGLGNCHTFAKLLPVDEYFDAHPEYFSEAGGKRIREQTQLCLTNPDVLRIVTEKVLDAIGRDPDATFFGVSQNDWQGFCTCATCRAVDDEEGSHAGTMIRFVNAIAAEVEKKHPDKIIETLAYQYTRKPPRKVRPRDNVMVCLCTIECDFSRPIQFESSGKNAAMKSDFLEWSKLTDRLYVWDYTTNFRCYLQPFPNLEVLQPNLRFFRDCGVVSVLEQGAYQGAHADLAELKAWLLAKLMWNADQPIEPLISRFLAGYYGKAAPFVKQYIERLLVRQRARSEKGGSLSIFEPYGASVCDAEFLEWAARLWREAEKSVAGEAERSYNVRMSALPTVYMLFMAGSREFRVPGSTAVAASRMRSQALAKWIESTMSASRSRIVVGENAEAGDSLNRRLRQVEATDAGGGEPGRLVIAMDRLHVNKFARVPGSASDRVFAPPNSGYDWYVPLQFGDVAYDADAEYRIRLRIKVDRTDGGTDGEAFWAGIYDNAASSGVAMVAKKASECGDGWRWYDVAKIKISDSCCLWVGSGRFDRKTFGRNPAIDAVYFDAVEIVRTDASAEKEKGKGKEKK